MTTLMFTLLLITSVSSMDDVRDPFEDFSDARPYAGMKFKDEAVEEFYTEFRENSLHQQPDNNNLRVCNKFLISKQQMRNTHCLPEDSAAVMSVEIIDGKIYQDGEILNTCHTLWALNPKGDLRILSESLWPSLMGRFGEIHHNSIFPKDGIGQPVACAGHMEVRNGKISKINRGCGHYKPTELQFILAIAYFNGQGILDETMTFDEYNTMLNSLSEITDVANMVEFL